MVSKQATSIEQGLSFASTGSNCGLKEATTAPTFLRALYCGRCDLSEMVGRSFLLGVTLGTGGASGVARLATATSESLIKASRNDGNEASSNVLAPWLRLKVSQHSAIFWGVSCSVVDKPMPVISMRSGLFRCISSILCTYIYSTHHRGPCRGPLWPVRGESRGERRSSWSSSAMARPRREEETTNDRDSLQNLNVTPASSRLRARYVDRRQKK